MLPRIRSRYFGSVYRVFVDSEPQTWNMDPELLEEAIKDRISKTGKKPKASYSGGALWYAV